MEPARLIMLALTASILLLVFALGLRATFAETTTLFRELFRPPNRLLRALVAIYVIVPVAAVALALLGDLSRPVKVALLAMAVAPIPPILPGKQLKFGGEKTYVFGCWSRRSSSKTSSRELAASSDWATRCRASSSRRSSRPRTA